MLVLYTRIMSRKVRLYKWWKSRSGSIRKPTVFTIGMLLVIASGLTGWLPGPGGIPLFILGMAVLASEFDWADSLKEFVLKKVPSEVRRHWRPTPKWELAFDAAAMLLLVIAINLVIREVVWPVLSMTTAAIMLFLFNAGRLQKIKKFWRRLRNKH